MSDDRAIWVESYAQYLLLAARTSSHALLTRPVPDADAVVIIEPYCHHLRAIR